MTGSFRMLNQIALGGSSEGGASPSAGAGTGAGSAGASEFEGGNEAFVFSRTLKKPSSVGCPTPNIGKPATWKPFKFMEIKSQVCVDLSEIWGSFKLFNIFARKHVHTWNNIIKEESSWCWDVRFMNLQRCQFLGGTRWDPYKQAVVLPPPLPGRYKDTLVFFFFKDCHNKQFFCLTNLGGFALRHRLCRCLSCHSAAGNQNAS